MSWKRILCPVDFSEHSRSAMLAAARLAGELGAELVLLHAAQVPSTVFPEGIVIRDAGLVQEYFHDINRRLDDWKTMAVAVAGRNVATSTVVGVPYSEIVSVAEQGPFDLIVMGTHGRTGLERLLLGSVTEKVVRIAPCPVLTIGLKSDHARSD
ncbi:MAG: universal stress protein [Deltaproteobacteria bacterium]|nr:universal stress protein [Deltaproteobacteria bacterium]